MSDPESEAGDDSAASPGRCSVGAPLRRRGNKSLGVRFSKGFGGEAAGGGRGGGGEAVLEDVWAWLEPVREAEYLFGL